MRWYLVRTPRGGIALDSRKQAQGLRDSLPKKFQRQTVEVIPLAAVLRFIEDEERVLAGMVKNDQITRGERAIHAKLLADLKLCLHYT